MADYQKALKLSNGRAEVVTRLTEVLSMQGVSAFNRRHLEAAVGHFDEAIELSPDVAELYFRRAKCYMEMQFYFKAVHDLEKTLQLDAKHYLAQNMVQQLRKTDAARKNEIVLDD